MISGNCYTIFNLISSDLKLISTLQLDFYSCVFLEKINNSMYF